MRARSGGRIIRSLDMIRDPLPNREQIQGAEHIGIDDDRNARASGVHPITRRCAAERGACRKEAAMRGGWEVG
jgi:hypothetical protein